MTKSKHIRPPRTMSLADRLERNSMPEPNSGCVLWLGSCMPFGHGRMRWGKSLYLTHRLAWMAHRGPIPVNTMVCHKCDVPSCINPDHLFLGDNAANIQDMWDKRRRIPKLTAEQVRSIHIDTRMHKTIAADYGISRVAVTLIKGGRLLQKHLTFEKSLGDEPPGE